MSWPGANLFRNPFGELTRAERADLAVVDLDAIAKQIKPARRNCYQWIGECGRGKTTRLLALQKHFSDAVYVYLPEDQPCPAIPVASLLLIDEAQRLPRGVRKTIFATGVPLILATHRDLSRPLRRHGYDVVTERIGLVLTPSKLATMLNRRIRASARVPRQTVPIIDEAITSELIRRFGTDIRAIESYLYQTVQSQVFEHGEMRFID